MFFDLNKLQQQSKNSPVKMLKMLENWYYNKIPKNNQMKEYFSKVSLRGDSFIRHPRALFSAQVDVNYKVQYLILAAKRDYLFFKLYGVDSLDLTYFPDLNLDKIKHNPLMRIDGNKLIFKL